MNRYIQSEIWKTKHTTLRKMIVFIPLLCIIVSGGFCSLGGREVIKLTNVTAINHWGLIWLPAMIAVITGLLHKLEKKSTGYKTIMGFPIKQGKTWLAKCVVITCFLLLASIVLWAFIVIFDLIFISESLSLQTLLSCLMALFINWFTVLWQIPLYLWLAQKINYFILMFISCGFSILLAPVVSVRSIWWMVPWAWTLRMQAPIIRLHPNGIPLDTGSTLLSYTGFSYAILFSILLMSGMVLVTKSLFVRREV